MKEQFILCWRSDAKWDVFDNPDTVHGWRLKHILTGPGFRTTKVHTLLPPMDTNTGTQRATSAPRRGRAYARRGSTPPTSRGNAARKNELNRPQAMPSSRKMSLMASVSRSSGLEKDGDE
jgi:hypothetical protein